MSLENEQIRSEAEKFSGKFGPKVILPAVVTAINDDDTIAIEFSEGATVDDARLKAIVKDGNKVLLIPKVGSNVLVGKIENSDEYVVLVVDEISEVQHTIGTVKYSVNDQGFLIQKGTDTLKDILTLIIQAVQPIMVIYGNNPLYDDLTQALTKTNNLFR